MPNRTLLGRFFTHLTLAGGGFAHVGALLLARLLITQRAI